MQPTEIRNSYISNIITLFFIVYIHRSVHIHSRNHTWRIMTWETSQVFFSAWSYTFTTVTLPYQILTNKPIRMAWQNLRWGRKRIKITYKTKTWIFTKRLCQGKRKLTGGNVTSNTKLRNDVWQCNHYQNISSSK
jgi:hypothetical protein